MPSVKRNPIRDKLLTALGQVSAMVNLTTHPTDLEDAIDELKAIQETAQMTHLLLLEVIQLLPRNEE